MMEQVMKCNAQLSELDPMVVGIMDVHFPEEEVLTSIEEVKGKKACGLEGIPCETLKVVGTYILSPLTSLLNYMLDSGEYPDTWAEGIGVPVPKGGDKHDPSNYRRKKIVPVLGKLLEIILYNRRRLYF